MTTQWQSIGKEKPAQLIYYYDKRSEGGLARQA